MNVRRFRRPFFRIPSLTAFSSIVAGLLRHDPNTARSEKRPTGRTPRGAPWGARTVHEPAFGATRSHEPGARNFSFLDWGERDGSRRATPRRPGVGSFTSRTTVAVALNDPEAGLPRRGCPRRPKGGAERAPDRSPTRVAPWARRPASRPPRRRQWAGAALHRPLVTSAVLGHLANAGTPLAASASPRAARCPSSGPRTVT